MHDASAAPIRPLRFNGAKPFQRRLRFPTQRRHNRFQQLPLRAFHPRHARNATEGVAAWRRELPYRAVKKLSDLLREHADTPFLSAPWRRAVRRAANRAGLLLCGDLAVAVAVLRRESAWPELYPGQASPRDESEADVRDLILFWLSPLAASLFERLHPHKG